MIQYVIDNGLPKQIQALQKRGGNYQNAAKTVAAIIGKINMKIENPFHGVSVTNHGESRIKHCVKYDLSAYARLITIQDNHVFALKFLGTHDECDNWLERNKGLNLAMEPHKKGIVDVPISEDIKKADKRISDNSDYSEGLLHKKIKEHYFDKIASLIPYTTIRPFLEFDSTVSEDELLDACLKIEGADIQTLFLDVFASLKSGDEDRAKNRILEHEDKIKLISTVDLSDIKKLQSNDKYVKIDDIDPEILKFILEKSDWYEWMLFLHPSQKEVVENDFSTSARLLGVSGSGKTCVLVHRAVRLAEKYPAGRILVLTLNESLARLIEKLVAVLLESKGKLHLQKQIRISSFWKVCKEYLVQLNVEGDHTPKIFNPHSDKHKEPVDDIWDEYYTCQNNNHDADILFPIHQTLLVRNVYPQDYIRQEFDWLRSAFGLDAREEYLTVEREGRYIPLVAEERSLVLEGLRGWETKMKKIGVADYLSLASSLHERISDLKPGYRCILVDEIQDFGTIELKIIRKLVSADENDLFICGDIAQQVYNKHHKIRVAGIQIPPEGYVKILQNYRNSREILQAAHAIFTTNVPVEKLNSEDFEVLNPEFANFSSPLPFLRKAVNFKTELFATLTYLKDILDIDKKEKACLAFCGLSIYQISALGKKLQLPVLDGELDLTVGNIFLSDLEQTKGFEFDRMIILNCSKNIIPNPSLPDEEAYRDICKLYVAMTRAKKELIMSYNREPSSLFIASSSYFTKDDWGNHISLDGLSEMPEIPSYYEPKLTKKMVEKKTGKQFLFSKNAIGLSRELQNKLIDNVAGISISGHTGKKEGWVDIYELFNDIINKRDFPNLSKMFGPVVFKELQTLAASYQPE